jgi:flavin-binding protein dodecin
LQFFTTGHTLNTSSDNHHRQILEFWHKVEFFIPFDLQQQVLDAKDAEWSVRTFSTSQLDTAGIEALWRVTPPTGRKLSGYEVYLGVFDKAELSEVAQRVVHETLTPEDEYDQDERGELEGRTCFARIKASAQGEPLLDDVSVSTAPWALGRIQREGLSGLDFDAFQADIEALKDNLRNFRANRPKAAAADPVKDSGEEASQSVFVQPLTASDLSALLDVFYDWAGYRPSLSTPNAPVIVIRAKSVEERAKISVDKTQTSPTENRESDDDGDDDEIASPEDSEIDILNSFYAQDIARAIASLDGGMASPALEAYLTPVVTSARIDLYRSAGRKRIVTGLQPDRLNTGHWLDRPCHAMSLMQQFAINSVFEQLTVTGIFSVNGPPGTGKTTLLRDIFAENIVRRARALSKFETSGEAFLPASVTVNFKGSDKPCKIALLREEIAGFEMVVASSNNAAVENISRDLPKTKSLGKPENPDEPRWRDEQGRAAVGYLQPVAHNVAARNGKGEYESLTPDDEPWGLISCALGKKSNRTAFIERISFAGAKPSEKAPKGFDPERHQSLWNWRERYKGIGYAQARNAFLKADQTVKSLVQQLDRYAKLHAELQGQTETSFTVAAAQAEQQARQTLEAAQDAFKVVEDERKLCDSQLALLKSEERLIEERRPKWLWWARLRKHQSYLDYSNDLDINHRRQGEWLRRKYEIEEPCRAAQKAAERAVSAHAQAQKALAERHTAWQSKQKELDRLSKVFPQAACPNQADDLEQDHWQIDGLWRDETLNAKRAELFAAALQLHEAWLAEVLKTGGRFGGNVVAFCHLLSGKRLQETQHALAIWRSLFLVVPVVSSTFASFASQFRDLGASTLGWLFIDEAGQAVPQAAVGALWRSKRAVVVGDPLQIEPVFTVPIKLIEALSKSSDLPSDWSVAPHRVSVQNLADAANPLGAWIGSGEDLQWIGSPLRVHRRCVDPMFSIANEIAYAGKMIFFDPVDPQKRLPPKDSLDLGCSAWVQAPGPASNKQAVATQVELVHQALVALYQRTGTLPPIYIISPFKRIKGELIGQISKPENWTVLLSVGVEPPKKSKLAEWCKARIGTVHTFQGKEESIVWMVLGCDERTQGAANWAADKPNLLNVALTRAKHRFFMIGDAGLWGGLRHFVSADAGLLPRISPDEFLRRMRQPPSTMAVEPLREVVLSDV